MAGWLGNFQSGPGIQEQAQKKGHICYRTVWLRRLEARGVSYAAYGLCHVFGKADREASSSGRAGAWVE
jgi:hypothetical protein